MSASNAHLSAIPTTNSATTSSRPRYFAPSSRAPRRSLYGCPPTFFRGRAGLPRAAGCHISHSSRCSWTRAFADLSDRTPLAAGRQGERAAALRHRPRSHRLTANLTANLRGQHRMRADDDGRRMAANKYAADVHGHPRTLKARLRKPLLYPLSYRALTARPFCQVRHGCVDATRGSSGEGLPRRRGSPRPVRARRIPARSPRVAISAPSCESSHLALWPEPH